MPCFGGQYSGKLRFCVSDVFRMKGGKLEFEDNKRKVMDANVHELDRYEIFDPRNPMNQRRREASKQTMKKGKR